VNVSPLVPFGYSVYPYMGPPPTTPTPTVAAPTPSTAATTATPEPISSEESADEDD